MGLLKFLRNSDGVQNTLPWITQCVFIVLRPHRHWCILVHFRHEKHPLNSSFLYHGNNLQTIVFADLLGWIGYTRSKSFSQSGQVFTSLETEQVYFFATSCKSIWDLKKFNRRPSERYAACFKTSGDVETSPLRAPSHSEYSHPGLAKLCQGRNVTVAAAHF